MTINTFNWDFNEQSLLLIKLRRLYQTQDLTLIFHYIILLFPLMHPTGFGHEDELNQPKSPRVEIKYNQ